MLVTNRYDFIYCPFQTGPWWETRGCGMWLFQCPGGLDHPFTSRHRIAILVDFMSEPERHSDFLSFLIQVSLFFIPLSLSLSKWAGMGAATLVFMDWTKPSVLHSPFIALMR